MTVAEQLKQEGIMEERLKLARNLLLVGDSVPKIAMVTGLSEEEVENLKKEIK